MPVIFAFSSLGFPKSHEATQITSVHCRKQANKICTDYLKKPSETEL